MKKILLGAVLFIVISTSCKKENATITYSSNTLVTGLWVGKFNTGASDSWIINLKSDSVSAGFSPAYTL